MKARREGHAHGAAVEASVSDRTVGGSLYRSLIRSHLFVAAIGGTVLFVALIGVAAIRAKAVRLAAEGGPAAQFAGQASSGLQRSVAALWGWMTVADEGLRRECVAAWKEDIRPALAHLNRNGAVRESSGERLRDLNNVLDALEQWQGHIVDVANTPRNEPARVKLERSIQPMAEAIDAAVASMIRIEIELEGDFERKRLLGAMAEFGASFTRCRIALGDFVKDTAEASDERRFLVDLVASKRIVSALRSERRLLTHDQRQLLELITTELEVYEALAEEVIALRCSDAWKVDRYLLATKAMPLASKAIKIANLFSRRQSEAMVRDAALLESIGNASMVLFSVLIGFVVVVAVGVARLQARKIAEPVRTLAEASRKLSEGRLSSDIEPRGEGEVAQLAVAFNRMRRSLAEKREELQRQSEERTRGIVEASNDGIVLIDERGRVQLFNTAAERLFGYAAGEVMGKNVSRLVPPPDREKHDGYIASYLRTGERKIIGIGREVVGMRRDRTTFPMDLAIAEIRLGDRRFFAGTVRDLTEVKRAEDELKRSHREVQAKNVELETTHRMLEERARELELASKYKSEFLANMSHELRTPLNSLLILAGSLAENPTGNLAADEVEAASIIRASGRDLLSLINDILDLSKVEAGKLKIESQEIAFATLVRSLRRQFDHVAKKRGLEFLVDIEDDIPAAIRTDMQRTEQILRNLLVNAFKFTEHGSVSLRIHRPGPDVRFFRSDLAGGGPAVALSVADTGPGIPPDKQRAVFEAFQQADGSTSRKYGGTGLGLTISKELAHLLGGDVQLRSVEGEGSTFTLYLPLKRRSAEDVVAPLPEPRAAEDEGPHQADELLRDAKVLLVDDDLRNTFAMSRVLRQHGLHVILADDGELAVEKLMSEPDIGIVIMDVMMPVMDGYEAMRRIRAEERLQDLTVIALTARAMPEDRARCFEAGADEYLTKPVELPELLSVMRRRLRARGRGQQQINATAPQ